MVREEENKGADRKTKLRKLSWLKFIRTLLNQFSGGQRLRSGTYSMSAGGVYEPPELC